LIYRLLYCSTATAQVNAEQMAAIGEQAKAANDEHDITGVLAYNSRFFLQSIEGARELVNDLYGRIARDPRNQHVVLVKYALVQERMWADWQIRFLMPTADTTALLKRYATQSLFNPYTMHPESAERMLLELSQLQP
jgi:hypothetical protein